MTARLARGLVLVFGTGVLTYALVAAAPPQVQRGDSAPPPPGQAEARPEATDRHGDPLPPGALARLGTVPFRHGGPIKALAFAPDGKTLASAGEDERIVLHDALTGKQLRCFAGKPSRAHLVVFAPDGKTLARVDGSRRVSVVEVETGELV